MLTPILRKPDNLLLEIFLRMGTATNRSDSSPKPLTTSFQLSSVPTTTTFKADLLNNPDPSKYCQHLGVGASVSLLQKWLDELDINQLYPRLPDSGNLAALVAHNDCLKKLVRLGVDLSRIESEPGVANLLVKTDFNASVAPKLWLFADFGFELPHVAHIFSRVPKTIIKVSVEEISSRLKYFTDRGFCPKDVVHMVSEQPKILALTSIEVDRQLGTLMNTFELNADQVRHIAKEAPKCIVQETKSTKDVFVVLTKMMGFPVATAREMVNDFPPIVVSSNRVLSANVFHLHKRLELPFDLIALCPRALCAPPRILKERTNFLKFCDLFQPDGRRPLYTPLDAIVQGSDEDFCRQFAQGKEDLFNDYLHTL